MTFLPSTVAVAVTVAAPAGMDDFVELIDTLTFCPGCTVANDFLPYVVTTSIRTGTVERFTAATVTYALPPSFRVDAVASTDNQPHFVEDGARIWSAKPEGASNDRYLALFNTGDKAKEVGLSLRYLGLTGTVGVSDLWEGRDLGRATGRIAATLPPHGAALYRLRA